MNPPPAAQLPVRLRTLRRRLLPIAALALGPGLANAMVLQDPVIELPRGDDRVLELSIENAVRIALRNNLSLQIEQLNTDVALFNSLGSWGAFDPALAITGTLTDTEQQGVSSLSGAQVLEEDRQNLSTSLNFPLTTGGNFDLFFSRVNQRTNNTFAAFDTSTTDVVTLSVTQPLLRGAWRRFATTNQRESELLYQRQIDNELIVRQGLVLDVYNAYWNLVSAREQLAVTDLSVQLAQEQVDQETKRLEVGAGTGVDVLQAEANLAVQQETRVIAVFNLRDAEDVLRVLLVRPQSSLADEYLDRWDWPYRAVTDLPEVETPAEAYARLDWRVSLVRAVESRAELSQARFDVDAAEVRLERAVSDRKPQLDLTLSGSSAGFDTDPDEAFDTAIGYDFPDLRGTLTFSMPIRNRTARYAERSARAGVRSARLIYDQIEMNVLAEIRSAVRTVSSAAETVAAARKSLDLALRQLEAEQSRRDNGLSTTFQVLQLQEDYVVALSNERVAVTVYAQALAALAFAEGRLSDDPTEGYQGPEDE